MTILAIDYGEKHIGLAVGDTETGLISPFQHLTYASEEELIKKLSEICDEVKGERVVLGLPLSFGFKKTKASEKVKEFATRVKESLNIPVEYENEILTSRLASRELGYQERRRNRNHTRNHAFSAALILESYFQRKNYRRML